MYEFRSVIKKDYQGICNLLKDKKEFFLVHPHGKYPLSIDQVEELSQVRQDLTVAIENKNIVAFANFYNYEPGKYIFIGNLIVDRSCRGKGLGKAIVSHMIKIAFGKYQLPEVRLSVVNENTPALLLYSRLGFLPYQIDEKRNLQDQRVALIHMKKSNT